MASLISNFDLIIEQHDSNAIGGNDNNNSGLEHSIINSVTHNVFQT